MATKKAPAKKPVKAKAEKPAKVKAEKPKTEKTKKDANGSLNQKATIWSILLLGKQNRHGKYIEDKKAEIVNFVPATVEQLKQLCNENELEPETEEEIVKALDSLGL